MVSKMGGGDKLHSKRKTLGRKTAVREKYKSILIVCEGERTEPKYFEIYKNFLRQSAINIEIQGKGFNTVTIVNYAKETYDKDRSKYDSVWCVFDRDSFPKENFNQAIELCNKYNFNAVYTNEAFELWYLLHYNYHDTGYSRTQYRNMLSKSIGRKYEKNDKHMFDTLKDMQNTAIKNAERLEKFQKNNLASEANPVTKVHHLVNFLNSQYKD